MPELFEADLLWLDGHDHDTAASSVSPYKIIEGPDMAPAGRSYQWTDSPYMTGATMIGEAQAALVERTIPLRIYPRFTSAYTNLLTNPRPSAVVTGWSTVGAGSTVTFNTIDTEAVIQAVTTGSANSGMQHSFTAAGSGFASCGVWVKSASGNILIDVKFDGETPASITATTSWQFVKRDSVTMAAGTRYLQIIQTAAVSKTFYVKMAGVVEHASGLGLYPGYFDGASGDAKWNGTAHASTSTTFTSQDAVNRAVGALGEKTQKAIAARGVAGIPLYWTPSDATYGRTSIDCLAFDVSKVTYDHTHRIHNHAECEVKLTCSPYALGPEYTAGTASKAAGAPALEFNITSAKGDVPGPCRLVLTAGSLQDQRFAAFGIQGRDYRSGTNLIVRAPSMVVTNYSGALTAATNEVQTLSKSGTVSGGTFTITLDGKTTSAIAYNATAATVQAALEALANIGTGNIACTGGPVNTTNVVMTFQGTLAGCNVSLMTEDDSAITGGGTLAIAGTTGGVAGYIAANLYGSYTTICDTGNLALVGDYRVIARVLDNAATTDLYKSDVRLTWGLGDLASTASNDAATPQALGDYSLLDLGHVQIPAVATGTQRFIGRIEAKSRGTVGAQMRVYDLMFFPMETGLGEVRAVYSSSTKLVGADEFSQAAGALTGKTADLGGNWAGTGDATDLVVGSGVITRAEVSDAADTGRFVTLATSYTDVRISVNLSASAYSGACRLGVLARYVDTSNYLLAYATVAAAGGTYDQVLIHKRVAGANTTLGGSSSYPLYTFQSVNNLMVDVTAAGVWVVYLNGNAILSGTDSALATGGALATGTPGIYDQNTAASGPTRTYDSFRVYSPVSSDTIAVYKSQDLQFRSNGDVLREDSAGSGIYSTPAIATVPFLPTLTPAGTEGLTNRLLVMTSRNNPDLASDPLPDAFDASLLAKPNYSLARWET